MKKIYQFLIVPAIAFGMVSCGGESTDTPATDTPEADTTTTVDVPEDPPAMDISVTIPEIPADFVEHDLSSVGLAGSIMGPSGAAINTSTLMNSEGEQEQINIQVAEDSGVKVQLYRSTKDFAAAKGDVEGNMINLFKQYVIEDDNSAFFYAQKNVDDSDVYNFILVMEKDGQVWHARADGGFDPLSKEDAAMLYAMAKTLK